MAQRLRPGRRHRRPVADSLFTGFMVFMIACGSDGTTPPPDGDGDPSSDSTFTNPLTRSGPDPWMTYYDGNYYLATTPGATRRWGSPCARPRPSTR